MEDQEITSSRFFSSKDNEFSLECSLKLSILYRWPNDHENFVLRTTQLFLL